MVRAPGYGLEQCNPAVSTETGELGQKVNRCFLQGLLGKKSIYRTVNEAPR